MEKKLDELQQATKDPNSPESQKFLKDLQNKILEHRSKMKKIYNSWINENKHEDT